MRQYLTNFWAGDRNLNPRWGESGWPFLGPLVNWVREQFLFADQIICAIARQAEAERDRRAKAIHAVGG